MGRLGDIFKRIRGFSTPFGGLTWEPTNKGIGSDVPALSFANITIPQVPNKRIGAVLSEPPDYYPFEGTECVKYLVYSVSEPVLDVTIINTATKPILLTSLGIEVVSVAQVWLVGAVIEPRVVKVDAVINVNMPDIWQELRDRGVAPENVVTLADVTRDRINIGPEAIGRRVLEDLRDPVLLDCGSPYRYILYLRHYGPRMPDSATLRLVVGTDRGEIASGPIFAQTYAHVLHVVVKSEKDAFDLAERQLLTGVEHCERREYERAKELLARALSYHARTGEHRSRIAQIKHNLGIIAYEQKEYTKAEHLLNEAHSEMVDIYASDDQEMSRFVDDLLAVYKAMGNAKKVEDLLKENPLSFSDGSEPTVRSGVTELLSKYERRKNRKGAIRITSALLKAAERHYGERCPLLPSWLNKLGAMSYEVGALDDAAKYFERAIFIYEQLGSSDPGSIAASINNLASVLRDQRVYARSEQLYKRAISILEVTNDKKNHAYTLRAYSRLLERTGRTSEAWRIQTEADALEKGT